MRLAILQQSYGRFGGAERLALSHYTQLRRMGRDVTMYYTGRISSGWKERLADEPLQSIPRGVASSPARLRQLMRFLNDLRHDDRIIIDHQLQPIAAYQRPES